MAQELIIRGAVQVKRRHPWGVWALSLITFGIYGLVYWYKVNAELRDHSAAAGAPLGNDPLASVLAFFPGSLVVVPPFVSIVGTARRVRHCLEQAEGRPSTVPSSPLAVIAGIFWSLHLPYLQEHVNRIWVAESPDVLASVTSELSVDHT